MKRSEQLNNKVAKLEEQLKEARKEARKQAKLEQKEAERKAYYKRVDEALAFLDLAKKVSISFRDGSNVSAYDYVMRNASKFTDDTEESRGE